MANWYTTHIPPASRCSCRYKPDRLCEPLKPLRGDCCRLYIRSRRAATYRRAHLDIMPSPLPGLPFRRSGCTLRGDYQWAHDNPPAVATCNKVHPRNCKSAPYYPCAHSLRCALCALLAPGSEGGCVRPAPRLYGFPEPDVCTAKNRISPGSLRESHIIA